ncbi:hypothetical protein [Shewanella glacialipiscicola]
MTSMTAISLTAIRFSMVFNVTGVTIGALGVDGEIRLKHINA